MACYNIFCCLRKISLLLASNNLFRIFPTTNFASCEIILIWHGPHDLIPYCLLRTRTCCTHLPHCMVLALHNTREHMIMKLTSNVLIFWYFTTTELSLQKCGVALATHLNSIWPLERKVSDDYIGRSTQQLRNLLMHCTEPPHSLG